MAGVVDGLQGHATGEGSIANHRHTLVVLPLAIAGDGHAKRRRNAGGGVTSAEMIEVALAALEVTSHAIFLAQGVEIVETAGDQLVGIGLMAHVPNHPVVIEIQGLIQGQGELHHTKAWAQVTTTGGHGFEMFLADLTRHLFEL